MPATAPIITAEREFTNAQGAVMATRPASIPLAIMPGSHFLVLTFIYNAAAKAPLALANIVLTAITEIRRSVPARVEPGLNPNQPNARMNVPIIAIGILWPGIVLTVPPGPYLPIRGPITNAPAKAATPPTSCTTEEPAKSTWPCPKPKLVPNWDSQPPPQTQLPKSGYTNIEIKNP